MSHDRTCNLYVMSRVLYYRAQSYTVPFSMTNSQHISRFIKTTKLENWFLHYTADVLLYNNNYVPSYLNFTSVKKLEENVHSFFLPSADITQYLKLVF